MKPAEGNRVQQLETSLANLLLEPPGWTRLEPQSVSGDPTPGLEARVFDPLWLLARQWQLGEFAAEDAGSPVAVHAKTETVPVTVWQPGDPAAGRPARPLPAGGVLEPFVQREATPVLGPGLRARAEAGAQFLFQLAEAGIDVAAAVLAACPLAAPFADAHDTTAVGLLTVLGSRVPDGEKIALALAPGLAAAPPVLPGWFDGVADPAAALAAVVDWYAWYRGQVAPEPDPSSDCWIDDRLEYRFSIDAGPNVLRAPAFGAERVDWYAFDADPGAAPLNPDPPAPVGHTTTLLATPLRFAGMPADRYWQFEDAQVNLGALEVQRHDLARLLLVEFATVYGNDWLVVPLDVPFGSYTTVTDLTYTTTFGEKLTVPPVDDSGRTGRFRMFGVGVKGTDKVLPGLLVPPTAAGVLQGPGLEEVLYLRDEMANKVWAVERSVEGPSGDPRSRRDEGYPPPFTPADDPGAELDYLLETDVPSWWIPFLPVSTGYRALALRKGAMVVGGAPVEPRGHLLRAGEPLVLQDEEVPREGVRVRRVPSLARMVDGSYARWVSRRVSVGRGEGASGLAFDTTAARKPPPA